MKAFSFLLFFLGISNAFSQSFIPFPDTNARWTYEICIIDWTPPASCASIHYSNYYLTNDTVINSVNYSNIELQEQGYHGAIRDNGNGQVYYFPPDSSSEYLVHDFDVEAGDTIQNVYSLMGSAFVEDRYVFSVDSILIWNNYHKIISFNNPQVTWIEGIGCPSDFIARSSDVFDATRELICMSHNDTIYYPNEDLGNCQLDLRTESMALKEIAIYPNPSSLEYINVLLPSDERFNYQIYSSSGQLIQQDLIQNQQITTPQQSGIYFLIIQGEKDYFYQKLIIE